MQEMTDRQVKPSLSFKTGSDAGLIEFYIDGELLTEWSYEDDPEPSFEEFKKIFWAGYGGRAK